MCPQPGRVAIWRYVPGSQQCCQYRAPCAVAETSNPQRLKELRNTQTDFLSKIVLKTSSRGYLGSDESLFKVIYQLFCLLIKPVMKNMHRPPVRQQITELSIPTEHRHLPPHTQSSSQVWDTGRGTCVTTENSKASLRDTISPSIKVPISHLILYAREDRRNLTS